LLKKQGKERRETRPLPRREEPLPQRSKLRPQARTSIPTISREVTSKSPLQPSLPRSRQTMALRLRDPTSQELLLRKRLKSHNSQEAPQERTRKHLTPVLPEETSLRRPLRRLLRGWSASPQLQVIRALALDSEVTMRLKSLLLKSDYII